jgi:hypothetical protein
MRYGAEILQKLAIYQKSINKHKYSFGRCTRFMMVGSYNVTLVKTLE